MLQSISETIFGSSPNSSPQNTHVNMSPRSTKKEKVPTVRRSMIPSLPETTDARLIESLKNEAKIKDAAIAALTAKIDRLEDEKRSAEYGSKETNRAIQISTVSNLINDKGRQKVKVGTRGSLLTQNILEALENDETKSESQLIAERFLKMFQDPVKYMSYLQSDTFASELIQVCVAACQLFEREPRCLFMQSPVYVFGDIHGNLEDLHFFSDNIWKMGMDLTAGQFLFLGDYVDRGMVNHF